MLLTLGDIVNTVLMYDEKKVKVMKHPGIFFLTSLDDKSQMLY